MACANNIGLNEITDLGTPIVSREEDFETSSNFSSNFIMEAQSRQSRIPKFGFGFKKILSNGASGTDRATKESSPKSSASVPRSKSMKIARTQAPIVQKRTKRSVDYVEDDNLLQVASGLLHPAHGSSQHGGSHSNPNSRSASPYLIQESSGSFSAHMTDSTSSGDSTRVQVSHIGTSSSKNELHEKASSKESPTFRRGHMRSSSFSSKDKYGVNRPSSAGNRRATVNTRPSKERSPQPVKHGMIQSMGNSTQVQKSGKSSDQTDGGVESTLNSTVGSVSMKRTESGNNSRRSSASSQGGRGKRPFSFHEGSPDLNQLASELSQLESSGSVVSNDTSHRGVPIIRTQRSPIRQDSVPTITSPTKGGSSKLRPPMKRNQSDENNRPSSAASTYKQNEARGPSRPRSAADVHKVTSTQRQTSHGSRSSTPSSGRSTPLFRKTVGIAEEDEEQGTETKRTSYDITPRRPPGSQIRSTGMRMGRTPLIRTGQVTSTQILKMGQKEGGDSQVREEELAVGLNELEGAVLIDAEDYRRMVQEVKTLKTMLLRLKRELTADGAATPPTSTPPTSMQSSVVRLKRGGGANNTELLNKIQKLTSERDKALQDIEAAKKNQKTQQNHLDKLKQELETTQTENKSLVTKIDELESHREYLMDKMERLHADKHKVEDRLNSLEKSAVYERTVLEEVWPEEDEESASFYDESLDNGLYYEDEEATF